MTKLYIANATQQIHQFNYWLPGMPRHFTQEIQIGSQIQVAGRDLTQEAVDQVLAAHRKYGLISVSEALSGKSRFYGLCYAIDKPVRLDVLHELVNRYRGILVDQGRRLREEAAVATDAYINDQMLQNQVPGRLDRLEMSVEEVSRDQRDESPEVSEGVRVTRIQRGEPAPTRRRGRGRAAA